MELTELAAYAREKYNIEEQHKWADFPGFSVLAEPLTGKWAALLMRQWDGETGEELQRCDIKCGRRCLEEIRVPWLTMPFRMKGQNWVGVVLDRRTDPRLVCRLFDRAVASLRQQKAYTVVLEDLRGNTEGLYRDEALPPRKRSFSGRPADPPAQGKGAAAGKGREDRSGRGQTFQSPSRPERDPFSDAAGSPGKSAPETFPAAPRSGTFGSLPRSELSETTSRPETIDSAAWTELFFREAEERSAGGTGSLLSTAIPRIPQKIREMMRLYEYRGNSLKEKSRNFYRQGKFMEDYEDDAPWTGEYRRYFTTYHDLHLQQLRGYFTWRTAVRRGEYRPIAASLAYMYVYELLCGIGTSSPEDSLRKMREFEKKYIDAGMGDSSMKRNLHRWMLEYVILHNVPMETAQQYGCIGAAEKDLQMGILKLPTLHTDEEILSALCAFGGNKVLQSPVMKREDGRGTHLFAALWRYLTDHYPSGRDARDDAAGPGGDRAIFTACFGTPKSRPWHPLENAVHWEEPEVLDAEYVLNECRTYRCRHGEWQEEGYDHPYFAKDRLSGLLHAADWGFRKYLKTGHYLRAKKEEEWLEPYIDAVTAADREAEKAAALEAEREAAMARITIDLSGLDRIRRDASITRDSLLTEAEMEEAPAETIAVTWPEEEKKTEASGTEESAETSAATWPEEETETEAPGAEAHVREPEEPLAVIWPEKGGETETHVPEPAETIAKAPAGLDPLYARILSALVFGGPAQALIKENRLMPSLVADAVNEALFEEIGDNVLEYDGEELSVVEDYREDLEDLLGQT